MTSEPDYVKQTRIQEQVDAWYVRDGRDRRDHPLHSVYTGLAQKYGVNAGGQSDAD
jgi:hypothetical protein